MSTNVTAILVLVWGQDAKMVVAGAAQSQWLYTPYIVLCQRSKASGEVASDDLTSDDVDS